MFIEAQILGRKSWFTRRASSWRWTVSRCWLLQHCILALDGNSVLLLLSRTFGDNFMSNLDHRSELYVNVVPSLDLSLSITEYLYVPRNYHLRQLLPNSSSSFLTTHRGRFPWQMRIASSMTIWNWLALWSGVASVSYCLCCQWLRDKFGPYFFQSFQCRWRVLYSQSTWSYLSIIHNAPYIGQTLIHS